MEALSAAATLQTPCQAALIAAYVHHSALTVWKVTGDPRGHVNHLRWEQAPCELHGRVSFWVNRFVKIHIALLLKIAWVFRQDRWCGSTFCPAEVVLQLISSIIAIGVF